MLSYQHLYHAGNLADVHKHSLLAWVLSYMIRKDKPLSYLETHAGRGLYNLRAPEAIKTGEAEQGIEVAKETMPADAPLLQVLAAIRQKHGPKAYPGSPLIAAELLRPEDDIQLCELHPQEFAALKTHIASYGAICRNRDGWEMAQSICPPTPRRGVLLVDPSFERKSDYRDIPAWIAALHRKWSVGVLILWYPILTEGPHRPMVAELKKAIPGGIAHEVGFAPARPGHRMIGSGLFVVNAPYGFDAAAADVAALFQRLPNAPM